MQTKNNFICARLTDGELKKLNHLAEKSKINRSKVICKLIKGAEIHEAPKIVDSEIGYQLAKIGNNINQIAKVANESGNIQFQPFFIEFEKLKRKVDELYGSCKN